MKHFLFLVISAVSFATMPAAANDATTAGQVPPASGSTGSQGQKFEFFKQALTALDLTDAQREQIKQIRVSTTDKKERRQQIMAILTPDQKTELVEMIKEHRNATQPGAASTATSEAN